MRNSQRRGLNDDLTNLHLLINARRQKVFMIYKRKIKSMSDESSTFYWKQRCIRLSWRRSNTFKKCMLIWYLISTRLCNFIVWFVQFPQNRRRWELYFSCIVINYFWKWLKNWTDRQYHCYYIIQNKDEIWEFIEDNFEVDEFVFKMLLNNEWVATQNLEHTPNFIMFKFKYLTYLDQET